MAELPSVPFTDDAAAEAWADQVDVLDFVNRDGKLLAQRLGLAVVAMGPLARGIDGRVWRYKNGVYVPEGPREDFIKNRVVRLFRDFYRPAHATVATDVVLADLPVLSNDPVEHLINCRNGLLDWRAGKVYPHTPDVRSTVQMAVNWNPAAKCPEFDKWLPTVVPPDCVDLVWELIAYMAYSGNPLHKAVLLYGFGRNGKGSLLRVIQGIIGQVNIAAADLHTLTTRPFAGAQLFGKLANIAGDIDGTYIESTAIFKKITGQDVLEAEHKKKDPFRFTPWAVPVFSANTLPASSDTSAGYLARWLIIPFPNDYTGREDRTIEPKLQAELEGIFARALTYLPALLARGQFRASDSADEAKSEFERNNDQVKSWLHDCCEVGEFPKQNRALVYEAYKRWNERSSNPKYRLRDSVFYKRLAGVPGIVVDRDRTMRFVQGVKIVDNGYPELQPYQYGNYPQGGGY